MLNVLVLGEIKKKLESFKFQGYFWNNVIYKLII